MVYIWANKSFTQISQNQNSLGKIYQSYISAILAVDWQIKNCYIKARWISTLVKKSFIEISENTLLGWVKANINNSEIFTQLWLQQICPTLRPKCNCTWNAMQVCVCVCVRAQKWKSFKLKLVPNNLGQWFPTATPREFTKCSTEKIKNVKNLHWVCVWTSFPMQIVSTRSVSGRLVNMYKLAHKRAPKYTNGCQVVCIRFSFCSHVNLGLTVPNT